MREYTYRASDYPGAKDATGYMELMRITCEVRGIPFILDEYQDADPATVVKALVQSFDEETATGRYNQDIQYYRRIRPQMDHPDFLRYVAGKMGAM